MSWGLCRSPVQQYEYKPLDKLTHEIRLLRPEDGSHSLWLSSRKLRFTVQTVQLVREDTAPSYYAISYAWGESVWSGKIYLDGAALVIPRGAEAAVRGVLKAIRTARLRMLPLWIDAICINQHDSEGEKSQQVSIMGDIFASANCVFIWYAWLYHNRGMTTLH